MSKQPNQSIRQVTVKLPAIIGVEGFNPTSLMIKTLCVYIELLGTDNEITPLEALKSMGKHRSNWYHWQKTDGFQSWWTTAINDFFTTVGLPKVYKKIYKQALTDNSYNDRKLYLERFDTKYKPTTKQEHTVEGIAPPDQVDDSIARSKARAYVDNNTIERTTHLEGEEVLNSNESIEPISSDNPPPPV